MNRKFLATGQEIEVKGIDGNVVFYAPLYEDPEESYPIEGPIQTAPIQMVYDKPPVRKLSKEVRDYRAQIAESKKELRNLLNRIREEKKYLDDMEARRNSYDELRFLDDYLQGKITHLLVKQRHSDKMAVWSVEKELKQSQRYDDGLKVICLFGNIAKHPGSRPKANRDLVWRINSYGDGSGDWPWQVLSFHSSEEEAQQAGREYLQNELREKSAEQLANSRFVGQLEEFGIPVPEAIQALVLESQRDLAQKNLEKAEKSLEEARARLAELSL